MVPLQRPLACPARFRPFVPSSSQETSADTEVSLGPTEDPIRPYPCHGAFRYRKKMGPCPIAEAGAVAKVARNYCARRAIR